jgi:hypothetical protein
MKKQRQATKRPAKKSGAKGTPPQASARREKGPVIGRGRFAKISEVEGIVLNERMTARIAELDRRGASAEERRTAIIRAYRKG